jgi:hypothetical protein
MTELLPLLLAAVLVYFVWRAIRPSTSGKPQAARAVAPALTWPALGEYEFEVVGESHYQRALMALAGDHGDDAADVQTTAVVVPYDSNPYDDKAVKVLIDGHEVGHLSRDDARSYRRRLAAKKQGMVPAQCGALIMGGFIGRDGERASYGVRLDMKPFE